MIRDEGTASVALDLIGNCFATGKQNSDTLHQSLRAFEAIASELQAGANVNKAKNLIQPSVKAIEFLILGTSHNLIVKFTVYTV